MTLARRSEKEGPCTMMAKPNMKSSDYDPVSKEVGSNERQPSYKIDKDGVMGEIGHSTSPILLRF